MHIIASYSLKSFTVLLFLENGKYGLCDAKNRVICEAAYDVIQACGTHGFLLMQHGKYGFIRPGSTPDALPDILVSCSYDGAQVGRHGIQFCKSLHTKEDSYLLEDFDWLNIHTGKLYPAYTLEREFFAFCELTHVNEENELITVLADVYDDRTWVLSSAGSIYEMPMEDDCTCFLCEEWMTQHRSLQLRYYLLRITEHTSVESERFTNLGDAYRMLVNYTAFPFEYGLFEEEDV